MRRTQTERRATSQRALLDAAAEVIAERGSSAASLAEIATVAGCSHSHPHYLFGSKANLLDALVREFSARFSTDVIGQLIGGATGLKAIMACTDVFVRSLHQPWPMTRALYVLIGESLGANPSLRPALNDYHEQLRALLAGFVVQGIDEGTVRADIDAEAAATFIVALVRGIGFQVLGDPDAVDLDALAEHAAGSIERYLSAG